MGTMYNDVSSPMVALLSRPNWQPASRGRHSVERRVVGVPVNVLSLTHDIVRKKEGDNDGFTVDRGCSPSPSRNKMGAEEFVWG
jgi:hypothetical protein